MTLGDQPVVLADATCPATSAAAALDAATRGAWDRKSFVSTILGESHTFAANDYWAEWVSNRFGGGLCTDLLSQGDELLMLVDVSDASFLPTVFPLVLSGVPARPRPGEPFTVTVTQFRPQNGAPGTGVAEPAAGASVGGATTGADGRATIALPAGPASLQAVRGGARSILVVACATTGADGACGAASPARGGSAPAPAARDRIAPRARITSIRDGARFAHGKGPRTLAGRVAPDPSGIAHLRLRLKRNRGGVCSGWDARRERLVRIARCGTHRFGRWFSVGTNARWSYLLPARLGRGRYVLDVQARDRAGNATLLHRGRTRVIFRVA